MPEGSNINIFNNLPEIWVLGERSKKKWETITLELIQDAQALGKKAGWKIAACIFSKPGTITDMECQELATHGADQVIVLENPTFGKPGDIFQYGHILYGHFRKQPPRIILCPSTPLWVDTASWLTTRYNGKIVQDCMNFRMMPDQSLEVIRYGFDNRAQMTLRLPSEHPWCICLRPGVAGVGKINSRAKAVVTRLEVEGYIDEQVQVMELLPPHPSVLDLTEADRVIAGGRGISGIEGFSLLEELAIKLEAAVGATRVAVDLGWVSYDRQIGQTGKTVKPRLFMSIGSSGASQHIDGMRESEIIIAINKDRNANIFKIAHLGVVGDARTIIQGLIDALEEKEEKSLAEMT